MNSYYECHITMEGGVMNAYHIEKFLEQKTNWKFSKIDGDINFGPGVKFYATNQFNMKIGIEAVIHQVKSMAEILASQGAKVIRRKVEIVIYDNRERPRRRMVSQLSLKQ